jgi:integrase
VLARGNGRPTLRQDAYHWFRRTCDQAGIGAFHPHELRHSWVSLLSDAGVDIEAIGDAAGHSSSTVTREVYRHRIAPELSAAAVAMDRIFGAGSASGAAIGSRNGSRVRILAQRRRSAAVCVMTG